MFASLKKFLLYKVGYQVLKIYWFIVRPRSLGTRVLIINNNEVLLVKHSYEPGWYPPGGSVAKGELIETAIRREAKEESGIALEDITLFGVYQTRKQKKHDLVVYFLANISSEMRKDTFDKSKLPLELANIEWFDLDSLPKETPTGVKNRVRDLKTGAIPFIGDYNI